MHYATAAAILARVDAHELARATSADTAVDGALLGAVIARPEQLTYSGYTTAAIAAARRAVVTIEAAIADASGDMDGYLSPRYRWAALADVPQTVQARCHDMVIWRLLGGAVEGEEKSERYQRVEAARNWLIRVQRGDIDLSPARAAPVVVAGAAPVFDRDTLAAY